MGSALIKLVGTTFNNPALSPADSDRIVSQYRSGLIWGFDFGNVATFPAQADPSSTELFYSLKAGATDPLTLAGAATPVAGVNFAGGGLDFGTVPSGSAWLTGTGAAKPRLGGKKKALIIAWVKLVQTAAGTQFYSGIVGQAATTNTTGGSPDSLKNSWALTTLDGGIGARFVLFINGTSTTAATAFSSTLAGVHQLAVVVDYVAGTLTPYLDGARTGATASFSQAQFGTAFPGVAPGVGFGAWSDEGQFGGFRGRMYRQMGWDMEAQTASAAEIVAADWAANNGRFS